MKLLKSTLLFLFLSLFFFLFPLKTTQALVVPGLTSEGTLTNGTYFGFSPQYGDINGDGKKDLIVASYIQVSNKGRIDIFFGNGIGFNTTTNITITGEVTADLLSGFNHGGGSLSVGDINGDGYDDILTGAVGNDDGGPSAGKIYIFYGSASISGNKIASEADISAIGNQTDKKFYGSSVRILDVNKDGKKDIIVIAGTSSSATSSKIYTYLNSNNTFDFTNPNFTFTTTGSNSDFYWTLSSGDFDGDGNADLLSNDVYSTGKLFLFRGLGTGEFVQATVFNAELAANALGRFRSISVSDINFDGKDDFCVGAYLNSTLATKQGRVYCFYGRSSLNSSYSVTNADIILNGQAANDDFGRTTYLYDVTGDGKPDLLVGAYQTDATAGSKNGKFFIYKNTNGTFGSTPWLSEVKTSGNTVYGNSVSAADWNNDGWANLNIQQGGNASSGTGDPVVNYYSISHGTPGISSLRNVNSSVNTAIVGTALESNPDYNISGVEWSTSSNSSGTWTECTASDGNFTFDSNSESFSCDISSVPNGTGQMIYIRSHDQNDLYMPSLLYGSIRGSETISAPDEIYQIPEGSNGSGNIVSGAITPIRGSDTKEQRVTLMLEPNTFSYNAYLYAHTQSRSDILRNQTGRVDNMIDDTQSKEPLSFKTPSGTTAWGVGPIEEVWYRTYPPRGSDKPPARIIPDLQSKPSIISLSYEDSYLIPPGDISHSFSPSALSLAYSTDGLSWTILPSSTVDPVNHTVAAIQKIGGYYTIVSVQKYPGLSTNLSKGSEDPTPTTIDSTKQVKGVTEEVVKPPLLPTQSGFAGQATTSTKNSKLSILNSKFCILWWCF